MGLIYDCRYYTLWSSYTRVPGEPPSQPLEISQQQSWIIELVAYVIRQPPSKLKTELRARLFGIAWAAMPHSWNTRAVEP